MLRRNVHPCVYNGESGTGPAERAYIRTGLIPTQWDQHGRARGSANVGQHLHYQQFAVKGL